MVTSCVRPCATCAELSLRVYSPASERSNVVYLVGRVRTSRFTSTARTRTAAVMAAE